jgi:hypothetical protein
MSDNKELKGKGDRDRVAGNEDYEVNYMAEKFSTSADMVRLAIKEVGNNREDVEKFLNNMKRT